MKARNITKGRTGTRTKNQDREDNIVSFMERTKDTLLEIGQMRRKLKKA